MIVMASATRAGSPRRLRLVLVLTAVTVELDANRRVVSGPSHLPEQ